MAISSKELVAYLQAAIEAFSIKNEERLFWGVIHSGFPVCSARMRELTFPDFILAEDDL